MTTISDADAKSAALIDDGFEAVTEDGGLFKKVLVEGRGSRRPQEGASVKVHYTGWTAADGEEFDSSRSRGSPFDFELGMGKVIKGWDEGVATMRKGERAVLKIREDYGYGKTGSPPKIPGGATLLFDVELLSWADEEDLTMENDGGVLKSVVTPGQKNSYKKPRDRATVNVSYVLRKATRPHGEELADDDESDGAAADNQGAELKKVVTDDIQLGVEVLPTGLERAIKSMKTGETAHVRIRGADYGFGAAEYPAKPDTLDEKTADLTAEVTLHSFENPRETWDMDPAEKVAHAEALKAEATGFFKAGRLRLADKFWSDAVQAINYTDGFKDKDPENAEQLVVKANELKVAMAQNRAMVLYKLKDYKGCLEQADKALELNNRSVKALYRRGQANIEIGNWPEAKTDLDKALAIDNGNVAVEQELKRLALLQKKQDRKDKKVYKKMLDGI